MKFRLILFLLLCGSFTSKAQQNYYYFYVQFHDKHLNYKTLEQARTYLSAQSLQRRNRQNIELDTFDLPVTQAYLDNISSANVHLQYATKWLNGAVIKTKYLDSAYRLKIKFYVDEVIYLGKQPVKGNPSYYTPEKDMGCGLTNGVNDYGIAKLQSVMINGIELHKTGYRGQGMNIAVFDAGFRYVNSLCAFKSMINSNRLIFTYDVLDGDTEVFADNDHGTNVLGVLAANENNEMIGSAPEANYALFRTEIKNSEQLLEELNWVRAAEMADSIGIDIINSSLGYNTFDQGIKNHTHEELDGKTSYISRAAAIAATRGMLVVNSSGNDGNKSWHKINFPADAPGILTVGAVDKDLNPPQFSSYGPTADYRIKPEISALGLQTAITTSYGYGFGNGTSFSCPVIAGYMACLWQLNPSKTPKELIEAISYSGHLFDSPDNVIGYGVPDFMLAHWMIHPPSKYQEWKTRVGQINEVPDTIRNGFVLNTSAPKDSIVHFRISTQKRFLFFKYKKKVQRVSVRVPAHNIVRFRYQIPKPKLSQTIYCDVITNGDVQLSIKSVLVK